MNNQKEDFIKFVMMIKTFLQKMTMNFSKNNENHFNKNQMKNNQNNNSLKNLKKSYSR